MTKAKQVCADTYEIPKQIKGAFSDGIKVAMNSPDEPTTASNNHDKEKKWQR